MPPTCQCVSFLPRAWSSKRTQLETYIATTAAPPRPLKRSDVVAFLHRVCRVRLALRRITAPP